MARGEDYIIRKKNKSNRKKLRSESAKVSNRVAAIIAQKKRRQSGKRRMCQGMCFSLPTLEDPFNDKTMNIDSKKKDKIKKTKKVKPSKEVNDLPEKGSDVSQNKRKATTDGKKQEQKKARVETESTELLGEGCPSRFLITCLKTIQDNLHHIEAFEPGKPLFFDPWGFEFWSCYSNDINVLETTGCCATMEQIAWIVSTAVDTISKKEKDDVSFTNPFLLFLVPSQEKAAKVRTVCKPLKAFGIHTVSLHRGASLDHQIHGLKTCEPEFLVCTPDRLLELVCLKAIDISGVCSLIVDAVDSSCEYKYLETVESIRQCITGDPHTVVFCSDLSDACLPVVSNLLPNPVCRLSRVDFFINKSAGKIQSIDVVSSTKEKLKKGLKILHDAFNNPLVPRPSKVAFIAGKDDNLDKLVSAISSKGYSTSVNGLEDVNSENEPTVCVIDSEDIDDADLSNVEVVIIYNFDISLEEYENILEKMARYTIKGRLHVILTRENAKIAAPLANVLQLCGQEVPEALKQLCNSSVSSS